MRRHLVGLALLAVVPASLSGAGFPSSEVQTAFAILSEPSLPSPVPEDIEIGGGRFRHSGGCDELRSRYQADDAPLPSGSLVTVDSFGNLQIDAPYGPAAVILAENGQGSCEYQIEGSPTLIIETTGGGRIDSFSSVLCYALIGYPAIGAEFDQAGEAHVVHAFLTDPDQDSWQVGIAPGTFESTIASEEGPRADGTVGSFVGTMGETGLIGDGSSDDGTLHIELRCTPFRPVPGLSS